MKSTLYILFFISLLFELSAQNIPPEANETIPNFQTLFTANMEEDVACYRIPAIVTAPNGNLIVAIDKRVPSCDDLRTNDNIDIVIRRSEDNGETWSEIVNVVDYPLGESASDPSMLVDEVTKEVFLFYNYMDLIQEKDVYYLKLIKSSDNGRTWGDPVDITSQITKEAWHNDFKFITSGRSIQTRSGKLLHTLVNIQHGLHLFASDDHGESWYLIDSPIIPGDESKVVELEDGSWMVNSRVAGAGVRFVHLSEDEGKTWISKPDSILVDPACNASIIRYTSMNDGSDKNRLLFSNANAADSRKNLTVRISYDEGQTWSEGKTVYAGGSAYSSMTVLANGDIGLFFEKDFYNECAFVRFSLGWLTDGQDNYRKP